MYLIASPLDGCLSLLLKHSRIGLLPKVSCMPCWHRSESLALRSQVAVMLSVLFKWYNAWHILNLYKLERSYKYREDVTSSSFYW
jgi:hypothetical protein